ncbi:MAG TPA: FHA domain-containing protein [Anaerolineales bacterium]|nr:FHA domain-containing protein [Anaerolineales bacterium]
MTAVLDLAVRLLPAVPLYAFLAWLLVALWRDGRSSSASDSQAPAAHLRQETPGGSLAFVLREVNLLGRAADNTIRLSDGAVSAYHARLSFQAGQWWLEDTGSRNGTMVNSLRLEGPLVVTYGDVIRLGAVDLVLAPGGSPSHPTSS